MPSGHRCYKVFLYSRGREIKEFGRHRGFREWLYVLYTLAISCVQNNKEAIILSLSSRLIIYSPFPVIHCLSNVDIQDLLYYHPRPTTLSNKGSLTKAIL